MTYVVTVDTRTASDAPGLDELQRAGAFALLEQGFGEVGGIHGPALGVTLRHVLVDVHPGGALLNVVVDAPALTTAEKAVRSLTTELLERSKLLSAWTVEKCEVELHPEYAKWSLEAAVGPDAPPEDLAARRARLCGPEETRSAVGARDEDAEQAAFRTVIRDMAPRLKSFGPEVFGIIQSEQEGGGSLGFSGADARLAAGGLVFGLDILIDELLEDVVTLSREDSTVADCRRALWILDHLPGHDALQYDATFARRFLVTAVALTTRFTDGSFQHLSCVAEELVLKLLLERTELTLELLGLLDDGVSSALKFFAEMMNEDVDPDPYSAGPAKAGEAGATAWPLRAVATRPADWFTPFDDRYHVHPYAADVLHDVPGTLGRRPDG